MKGGWWHSQCFFPISARIGGRPCTHQQICAVFLWIPIPARRTKSCHLVRLLSNSKARTTIWVHGYQVDDWIRSLFQVFSKLANWCSFQTPVIANGYVVKPIRRNELFVKFFGYSSDNRPDVLRRACSWARDPFCRFEVLWAIVTSQMECYPQGLVDWHQHQDACFLKCTELFWVAIEWRPYAECFFRDWSLPWHLPIFPLRDT